jgi:hypothetical protein
VRIITTLLLFSATLFADPSLLPLQDGNFWTYQDRGRLGTFTIRVGTPSTIDGNVYHRLTGYVSEPLWVRFGDRDGLYYRDEENGRDVLLTSFERSTGGRFQAPFRICDSFGQAQNGGGKYEGPIGSLAPTLVIRYENSGCADIGMIDEQYAPNIGMVERTEQSFTGPRVYDLIAAKVGAATIQPGQGASVGLTLRRNDWFAGLVAILELRVNGPDPVTLHFTSSQQYDAAIRNERGESVWHWSANKLFLQVLTDEVTHGRTWTIDVPLTNLSGQSLPPGKYSLEAWITSGHDRTQFAATAPFQIPFSE